MDHVQNPLLSTIRLGPTELRVTDLDRSIEFYERSIGLSLVDADRRIAYLGTERDNAVLVLREGRELRRAGQHAGLYHVALLYPGRAALAEQAARLVTSQTGIQGTADHGTHEAIYLPDPDGNGLELAADRPRDQWPTRDVQYGAPTGLDVANLMTLVSGDVPDRAEGVTTGHLHLHVGNIQQALEFYTQAVGFDQQFLLDSAAFVAADGYHHHLAFNVWKGEDVPSVPDDVVGMDHWTIYVADPAAIEAVIVRLEQHAIAYERRGDTLVTADPWNNRMSIELDPRE